MEETRSAMSGLLRSAEKDAMLSTNYVPGAPAWVDLTVPDVAAAAAFYEDVFDWESRETGPKGGGYLSCIIEGRTVAAIGPLTGRGVTPAWTLHFRTTDADATAKAVEQAGGTVRRAPLEFFDGGRVASFTDPAGAQFAVWEPGDLEDLGAVAVKNTLCWSELYTPDLVAAKTFYRSVFDWTTEDVLLGGFTYMVVRPSGGDYGTEQGGILELTDEMVDAGVRTHWLPYFKVADCSITAAEAAALGATISMPPEDIEGIGRLAQIVDPFGAPLSLISGEAD
jgi:predicted enzyme related to lactoylglutathione lyase